MLLTQPHDPLRDGRPHPARRPVRGMRAIAQPRFTFGSKSLQNLVPRLFANPKPIANVHDPLVTIETRLYEFQSLAHR